MNNFKNFAISFTPILLMFLVFTSSCTKSNQETLLHDMCDYQYQATGSKVTWTAYKFTSRAGVSGNFDQFKITPPKQACHNIDDVLRGAKIELTATTLLGDSSQKATNLRTMFFGQLKTTKVQGKVLTINPENKTAQISLTFNDVTRTLNCDYNTSETRIELMTTLNLENFKAENCIDSLHTVCGELHKGEDGIMMTWLDVDVKVEANLRRVCN